MKRIKLLVIATLAFAGLTMQAQEVKQIEASVEDYIALLNQSGYQAYSFDISQLMDTTYYVQFEVREYVAGNPEPVMRMVSIRVRKRSPSVFFLARTTRLRWADCL